MKRTYFGLFVILLLLEALGSCKKETTQAEDNISAFTIVNGLVGDSSLTPNFTGTRPINVPYNQLKNILYGTFTFYSSYSGPQKLGLYQVNSYPDTTIRSK